MNARVYTTAQLVAALGCTKRALHFYEERGLLSPTRRAAGKRGADRIYSEADRKQALLIIRMRSAGIALSDIKKALKLQGRERLQAVCNLFEARAEALEAQTEAVSAAADAFIADERLQGLAA